MLMKAETLIINNLKKALRAEERHGFTNSGALGGFSSFLQGLAARLERLSPEGDWSALRRIAEVYQTSGPSSRRALVGELVSYIAIWEQSSPVSASSSDNPAPEPVLSESASVKSIRGSAAGGQRPAASANSSLRYVKGIGPERVKLLAKLGINTLPELFLHFPRRYEDRRPRSIGDLKDGDYATVIGTVTASQVSQGRIKVIKLSLEQEGRLIYAVWFNQAYILKQYPVGTSLAVSGKVRWNYKVPEILVSDSEMVEGGLSPAAILPVYSETAKLSSKVLRKFIQSQLEKVTDCFPEYLPPELKGSWMARDAAYREMHFPSSFPSLGKARDRLVWEEVLFLQLAVARLRQTPREFKSPVLAGGNELVQRFRAGLPYKLTQAQERVLEEIFRDMAQPRGMTRLVQGDVGSGKTVVAMAALLQAAGSGYQGAMMAPTEVLAWQHYQSLREAFTPLGITVVSLLGSHSRAEREENLELIASGRAQIVVGTHALIQENVKFYALGLAVTDEQHRFGVRQRSQLQEKGAYPHVLVMTATPIPRTLALTLYGDLQISVVDEMPAGRKPIITRKLSERSRPSMERFLAQELERGRQVYVVCPLVEESEALDLVSATEQSEDLKAKFPDRRVELLHGRMKGSEKEEIMRAFQAGEINILVSTTVIEVGVNVPNATVMVIEQAERFGLAQLHQLRGRVGRGSEQSYCILMTESPRSKRLDILCQSQDGFKIAEEDLKLRGPGELLGTRQHGLTELRLADLAHDGRLVEQAYVAAQKILAQPENYPEVWREMERFHDPRKAGIN
ncbi:ATP-dependent DNA helicase RecG [Paradesulfitobacterium ferrireducens]|uniref:ATP-dependent DNA helicase RecG n=1 Tax=Paradesulfitobacterium ferrireducens TaxID=2816476 RepID=UPI0038B371DC